MANILVLEDDPQFGPLLCASLEDAGHTATLRKDGTSAQLAFRAEPFDVVIADIIVKKNNISIPDGGILLSHRVCRISKETGREVPIIAISGQTEQVGMQDILLYAKTMGANDVLRKPFAPNELLGMISRLLSVSETG